MKIIYKYLAHVIVLALLVTSCSKDDPSKIIDDPANTTSVDLTFGAVLNDLSNRAMASLNKSSHFSDVPDCSDADPAVARIGFSYNGNSYQTDVAILSDESGFFTDYSEDLKIPVPNGGEVDVTLDSFMVYDGDPDAGGQLIWLAPIESQDGEFDGYVDHALPFEFQVQDGTKPYIDVEVLCFDRRMVNEYGYVFFDILPEKIYPLCLFVNYCDENGRHYVADYSVDLYFGQDANGIQLYDHEEESAMATTGNYGGNAYYADPLCLVVPGPPANLPANQPYLYLVIYPEDWDGNYGNIDNTPTQGIQLSWNDVNALLNDDGETNEYYHVFVGECEDAIGRGDGNGNGGNGGNGGGECNPSSPDADCDNDGTPNRCDPDNVNYAGFDCDNDDIPNGQENQGCVDDPDPNCGENGGGEPQCSSAYFGGENPITGFKEVLPIDYTIPFNIFVEGSNEIIGTVDLNPNESEGGVNVVINLDDNSEYEIRDYTIWANTSASETGAQVIQYEGAEPLGPGENEIENVNPDGFNGTNLYLKIEFEVCEIPSN